MGSDAFWRRLMVVWLTFAVACHVACPAAVSQFQTREAGGGARHGVLRLGAQSIRFDAADPADLHRLLAVVEAQFESGTNGLDPATRSIRGKRFRRGLLEVQRLTKALLEGTNPRKQQTLRQDLCETTAAINNLARAPVPETVDFFQTPWFFIKRLPRAVGTGHTLASNLRAGNQADPSRADPEPSSFWRRPPAISGQDLYHGFGRSELFLALDPLCTYAEPKESFGRNPGFEVECQGATLKLKFAEVCSEPFASRVFWALGYHVDPTDCVPRVRVRYTRRLLQEFNSRKPLKTHFTFLGFVPLFTLDLQKRYDPFDYLAAAVLKDGTRWSSTALKQRLFRDLSRAHPEELDSNFRPEVESSIAYLETVAANVQCKIGKSIGPWDFGDLDHATRRELRGAGLLAGWLGWFDTRFDNTRLRIVQHSRGPELEHYFSDLGGVLGETAGLLYWRGEKPNAFPWSFTRPVKFDTQHDAPQPFRLAGYKPIARTAAFSEMTADDARWMARLIGDLSEEQIKQALIASGFNSAETRLYLEKLLSRRDKMIRDLGLGNEIPLLRPLGYDHRY